MKLRVFILVVCAFVVRSIAQESDNDTTRVYRVPEVVVTATRSPIHLSDSPSPVSVITFRDIMRMNAIPISAEASFLMITRL